MLLQTERLILRLFREADLPAYAAMVGDAETMRYVGTGQAFSREEAWRSMALMVGHWHLRGYGLWAVEEKASGEMIGRIGCWNPEGWPGLEVGWMLRKEWRGRGFALEAAQASLHFAFTQLDCPHVISLIRPGNTPSIKVAERLGETLEGKITLMGQEVLVYGIDRAQQRRGGEI
jgi:RimJ/RimL family protein N-acetyltransferase